MGQQIDLLDDLSSNIQSSFIKITKQQHKQEEGTFSDYIKYLPLNQFAVDNQDVFGMKYINDRFVLSQFIFQQRYDEQEYQVKLLNSFSGTEIHQEQYRNAIFEFSMNDNYALLLIKQQSKTNNIQSEQQSALLIKEVFTGTIQDDTLYLNQITNINICKQVAFHPLNSNYLVILQASQDGNRSHTYQKDQFFLVFEMKDLKQPIVRINLNSAMNGNVQAFCLSLPEDNNSFLIYFVNNLGIVYYYELILPDMAFKLQTKMYLQTSKQELIQFVKEKNEKEFTINYKMTTQDDYQMENIRFKSFQNQNYQLPKNTFVLFKKVPIVEYYLFIFVSKQLNNNLTIQVLIGRDLNKLYEIYNDEVQFSKYGNDDLVISQLHKYQQPQIIYSSEYTTQLVQNSFDLLNKHQMLLLYHNSLISIDFTNVVQYQQNQSPINVTCIDLISSWKDQSEQFILQVLCIDLFKSKQLLVRINNKNQRQTFQFLPQKLLLGLTESSSEINKITLDFYQEQNVYLTNKSVIQQFKKYLEVISNKRLPQCKTEQDIISINEDLSSALQSSIKEVAIKIKLEAENMNDEIDIKMRGDLTEQQQRNLQLQLQISQKNEKINSLLEKIHSIQPAVLRQQFINQQQQQELDQFELQFKQIQEHIKLNQSQLEGQIQISNRTKQEIESIQSNLIQQILQKKE
ncbi:unnamed protein product (macronuclear) [Paramecium tetraurelia]|uniref:Uncharacterized protein n=1 Tax=Paramecium tetraurelia TaxID=5888 RepID=A0DNU8_PARTE|nr:uncharacterized protein GSPATT00018911001 [Paramecium tetraurelia]CAK84715.1 unnamed protein product [Paramecium tetraurelia]|eukprot:XP_001452112.1 hypothetical protein (macronuclear) [Paramecium tetraurelia strain d4-2]